MAKGLLQVVGVEAEGTAEMILFIDKMFDCLNVTNCSEGIRKRKLFKVPYTHAGDWRLKVFARTHKEEERVIIITLDIAGTMTNVIIIIMQWLEGDFLQYLRVWEESVAAKQDVSKEDKNRMLLSKSTRDGIEMTGNA